MMRSDIRNVRQVYKYGAYGDPNAMGIYVYGRRPDGRTVACKSKLKENGVMSIWSYFAEGEELLDCYSEFAPDEWARITAASESDQARISNAIIDARIAKLTK